MTRAAHLRWRHPADGEILRLAVPALGALAAEPLYVLADTAVVGHLGTDSLGGLAVASSVLLVGFSLAIFLAYGTTSRVARLLGAGKEAEAADEAVQGLWLAALLGVVVAAVGLVGGRPLLGVLGAEGRVLEEGTTYLLVSLAGVPSMLVVLAGIGYLRGRRDTATPLWVAIGSAAANLVIELVLIQGFGFGIGASALATVIAQTGAAAVYVVRVVGDVRALGVGLGPRRDRLVAHLGGARHLFLRTASLRASLFVTTAVAARLGTVPLAAHQVAFEVWNTLAMCLDAIAIAAQAMIGEALGAGDAARARELGRRMLVLGVAAGVAFGVVVLAVRVPMVGVFSDDGAVVALAATLLVCVAALEPLAGVVFVLDGVLIGAGDLGFLARAMFGALVAFVPAALAVLVTDAHPAWLWAALGLLMVARAVALGRRFAGDAWAVTGASAT